MNVINLNNSKKKHKDSQGHVNINLKHLENAESKKNFVFLNVATSNSQVYSKGIYGHERSKEFNFFNISFGKLVPRI